MNTLASYRYQMADHKWSILIYYLVIVGLSLIIGTTIAISINYGAIENESASSTGLEMPTLIFLFVVGLCTFKETFLMSLQNGVSRKTLFTSKIMTIVSVALIMSVVDKLLYLIYSLIFKSTGSSIITMTAYESMYARGSVGTLQIQLESLLFEFVLALAAMACGYFISIMFYRLNKLGKVLVGAGVPALLFFGIPILDFTLFSGAITQTMSRLMAFACGTPMHMIVSSLLAFVIFSAAAFVLMRRAVVKR